MHDMELTDIELRWLAGHLYQEDSLVGQDIYRKVRRVMVQDGVEPTAPRALPVLPLEVRESPYGGIVVRS